MIDAGVKNCCCRNQETVTFFMWPVYSTIIQLQIIPYLEVALAIYNKWLCHQAKHSNSSSDTAQTALNPEDSPHSYTLVCCNHFLSSIQTQQLNNMSIPYIVFMAKYDNKRINDMQNIIPMAGSGRLNSNGSVTIALYNIDVSVVKDSTDRNISTNAAVRFALYTSAFVKFTSTATHERILMYVMCQRAD